MSGALPALVDPGEDLTPAEARRYSRHLLLPEIGVLGQRRLKTARVLVVGAGGLGSPALLYLAAAGVGTIGIVDDDVVEESNLQRQVAHRTEDVGRAKVDSAADAVARANPLVRVVHHRERFTAGSAARLVTAYDLVLDGSDNFATRYLVNDACVLARTPWVWGAVLRFDGQVSTFWAQHGPTYRDLFPQPPGPGTVPSCGEVGVLGGVCAMVGSVMVTEAVKLVTGSGRSLLGRVLVLDALSTTWRTLALRVDPTRPVVTAITPPPPAPRRDEPALPVITPVELADRLRAREEGARDFLLVDVREPGEHAAHAIPGALLVPLGDLLDGGGLAGVPHELPWYCTAPAAPAPRGPCAAWSTEATPTWRTWPAASPHGRRRGWGPSQARARAGRRSGSSGRPG